MESYGNTEYPTCPYCGKENSDPPGAEAGLVEDMDSIFTQCPFCHKHYLLHLYKEISYASDGLESEWEWHTQQRKLFDEDWRDERIALIEKLLKENQGQENNGILE